jgi:hypothetical protein
LDLLSDLASPVFAAATAVWKITKVHSCSPQATSFGACGDNFLCRSLRGHQAGFSLEFVNKAGTGWTNNTSSFIGENPYS